jgi:phosphoenolpyruvate synthase/pyruvate phosphate dikinase
MCAAVTESAEWLVHEGIDSISLNPDVANFDRDRVAAAEPPDRTATSA